MVGRFTQLLYLHYHYDTHTQPADNRDFVQVELLQKNLSIQNQLHATAGIGYVQEIIVLYQCV